MITLRDVTTEDSIIIYQWKNDSYLQQMALGPDYETTISAQQDDIEKTLETEFSEYKMILLDDQPIGYIRIDYMDETKEMVWLRFALGEERGHGYAEEALRIYLEGLFRRGIKRIEGEVYEINVPSHKIMTKLGFINEGIKRKAHFIGSEYIDIYVYGLLEEDYNK
ncbi:Acetyltransferase (GNAT) family protein [Candidatus Izimaplasma bacterium HR1]|jgi:RimJ/RimL family protein N-acetyltransferase|uniref:GNAT family N-acetyltransferase n=1 Tax=Candidatus Izimoplasma sp. HR1 TaxID=1541959 RepID=UPI0004F6F531|nr:Acetyltransferase (GNAT) family protein [Candidatus Izimaplasma bacterium HR1]